MPPARSTASHASVAFLRIPDFAQLPVAEQADLKERLENVVAAAMPPVRADDHVGANFQFAPWSFRAYAGHTLLIEDQIDHFVLHQQLETRKFFCVRGKEIEEIPLRHERDEFEAHRQVGSPRSSSHNR